MGIAFANEQASKHAESGFDTFVFDLDGTLLDTLPDLVELTNQALAKMSYPLHTTEEIKSYVGNGVKALMCQAVPEGTSEEDTDRALSTWKEMFVTYANDLTQPYEDMPETIERLHDSGAKLAVLSNKFDRGVQDIMGKFMGEMFPVKHGECEAIPRKPNPEGMLRTIRELGSVPARSVYIGDSPGDILAAKNAGVFSIAVTWGYHDKATLFAAQPDAVIEEPSELLLFFKAQY